MEYENLYRENIKETISQKSYDIFISAYNTSERIQHVYNQINASKKEYLVFPEYSFDNPPANTKNINSTKELKEFFDYIDIKKRIIIDITGFIRPYLIFLTKILKEGGFKKVGFIYSEPVKYKKAEDTEFSSGEMETKEVEGFANESGEGDQKMLIIGAGFDKMLFSECINQYSVPTENRRLLIGFPSLSLDMYQQNMLRIHEIENYSPNNFIYAPASHPFITAQAIEKTVREFKKEKSIEEGDVISIYLAPLSTKAQVLGFSLYALVNDVDDVTIFFPYTQKYAQETTEGIARIWKYEIDFSEL